MKEQWENRWAAFRQWMRDRYQLIVRNKAFEEKLSIELSRWHVLVAAALAVILLIALTTLLIAFTPLREYIPGYGSAKQSKKMYALRLQMDSLSHQMDAYEDYAQHIRTVMNGDFPPTATPSGRRGTRKTKPPQTPSPSPGRTAPCWPSNGSSSRRRPFLSKSGSSRNGTCFSNRYPAPSPVRSARKTPASPLPRQATSRFTRWRRASSSMSMPRRAPARSRST